MPSSVYETEKKEKKKTKKPRVDEGLGKWAISHLGVGIIIGNIPILIHSTNINECIFDVRHCSRH